MRLVGIVQEQHPDRARLFMQWKEMDWPLMQDPLNLLEVPAVPITVAIDEAGVVRMIRPDKETFEREFLDAAFELSGPAEPVSATRPDLDALRNTSVAGGTTERLALADALVLWGDEEELSEAIRIYEAVLEGNGVPPAVHFHAGVAYRKRYDSAGRRNGDFQRAVDHWRAALDLDPNQYIWRRRIQQYGPRLDKPYPFYDWVREARADIRERGETPVELRVEPGGAEFAAPAREFSAEAGPAVEPDAEGRIHPDTNNLATVETTLVPGRLKPGEAGRVHVVFRPNEELAAHWNNEQPEGLIVWINPPDGWQVTQRRLEVTNVRAPLSREERRVEFEVRCPLDAGPGVHRISGYGLYYVCEDVDGACLYLRRNLEVSLRVSRAE